MQDIKKLVRKRIGSQELDSLKMTKKTYGTTSNAVGLSVLMRGRRAWENLEDFRQRRARSVRFCYGDQWGDPITVRIKGKERTLTMREYLELEGNIPLQTNQIKSQLETMVGIIAKEQDAPMCSARDRDEQQYGEVLTEGLRANNETNRIQRLHFLCIRDYALGGLAIAKERYGVYNRREDSWSEYVNPNLFLLETTFRDHNYRDITMVGTWYEMPMHILLARMAHSREDVIKIKNIYGKVAENESISEVEVTDQLDLDNIEFMQPTKPGLCCIAEIWTLETKERYRVHDEAEGTEEVIDADDRQTLAGIRAINAERTEMCLAQGWAPEEIPLIQLEPFTDEYWYCRMIAPDGTVLWEEESPYPDRMHPFTIMVGPFIDGRISGYLIDAIDHQIAMNRVLVLQDWIVRNQVKGVTWVPDKARPDSMSEEDWKESLRMDDIVFYDPTKAKGYKPEVLKGNAVAFDASGLITSLKTMMESSNAISGAIQGKTPYSGTSAALYAQQTANSSTPLAPFLADVRAFMEDIAAKKIKNIAKFWSPERWEKVVGAIDGIFDNANLNLNDIAHIEFDVSIKESTDSPVYSAIMNDTLMSFFNAGAIDLRTLLECGRFPFADRIIQKMDARQTEMEETQGMQGNPQGAESAEIGDDLEEATSAQPYGVPVQSTRPLVQ